jgi:hypothetical protein
MRQATRPQAFPAIIEPKRFGDLASACDNYAATPVCARLKLAPMLRCGRVNCDSRSGRDRPRCGEWTVPAARMKRELREKGGAPHRAFAEAGSAMQRTAYADGQDRWSSRRAAPRPCR